MAVWPKALPLTARCLSPQSGFETHPGHVRKLPVAWGYAKVLAKYFGFLHQLQPACLDLLPIGQEKVTKNEILIPNSTYPGSNELQNANYIIVK